MRNWKKVCTVTAVVAVALAFTAPLAAAKHLPPDVHGDLSRTFLDFASFKLQFKNNGLGWYDPVLGTICLFSLLAIKITPDNGFYYDRQRVGSNFNKHLFEGYLGIPPIPLPCPFPGPPGPAAALVIDDFNVYTGDYIDQDALLCTKKPFSTCLPVPGTISWDLYACPIGPIAGNGVLGVGFNMPGAKPSPIFPPGVGSAEIWCSGPPPALGAAPPKTPPFGTGMDLAGHRHDVSAKIDLFGPGFVGSSLRNEMPLGLIVHPGNGNYYVISCLGADVFQDDPPLGIGSYVRPSLTHDWLLVLDRMAPFLTQLGAVQYHEGISDEMGGPSKYAQMLPGLYDLSGQNGCPLPNVIGCPQEDKKPLPGGPKPGQDLDCDGVVDLAPPPKP